MGRAFWEMADADAKPAAAFYLDLVAAFASIAMDLLCETGRGYCEVISCMRRFGVSGSLEEDVCEVLRGPDATQRI
eukprot:4986226-Lingulodinium_polyedra.AAC.1